MHKSGNRVYATVEEIFAMKGDEKAFSRFCTLARAWIEAEAFKLARRTRADVSEARTWLAAGLWDAVNRADDRTQGVGIIFTLACKYASKAYVSQYVNVAQKTEDACDSCNRGDDGEFEEIQIPDLDESHSSLAFRGFMENLRSQVSSRDFLVIQKRLDGYTLEEIGESIGISKQGVDKIFKKNLPKLRAFA